MAVNKGSEIKKDEDVERVRRAHLNDLENIPPFLFAAFFYVMSEPQPDVGLWLIRIAVIARILHTFVSFLFISCCFEDIFNENSFRLERFTQFSL